MDPPSRHRRWQSSRKDTGGLHRTARPPPPQPAAGAGERGPPPRCRLPFPGELAGKSFYPLVSELAADGIPVAVSLRVLKLSRQPYYRWRHQQVTTAELTEAYRANALLDAHVDDPEYGYRFLVGEAAEAGEAMCERTAWWICRDNQWWSVFGKKRGKNGKRPGPPVHDDLVKRDFSADDVNELWLTDITEHWTDEGKLYLCAIKDVFSGRIVGYSIADRMKARLAVNALDNAMSRRRDAAGCIVHSDRGSQGGFNRWLQHRYFQSKGVSI
ncbi:hypothetical protein CIK61_08380 [Brevibacterium aurantiacum]|nr:hypothetical protein CIK61_08380 [Brevibacterium aurantiacum]